MRTNKRRPNLDQIEADLAKRIHISFIRAKYNLARNQAAGLYARYWGKQGRYNYGPKKETA